MVPSDDAVANMVPCGDTWTWLTLYLWQWMVLGLQFAPMGLNQMLTCWSLRSKHGWFEFSFYKQHLLNSKSTNKYFVLANLDPVRRTSLVAKSQELISDEWPVKTLWGVCLLMIVFFELPLALLERQAISSADVFCHKHTIKAIHVNLLSSSLSVAFSGRWWTESIHLTVVVETWPFGPLPWK